MAIREETLTWLEENPVICLGSDAGAIKPQRFGDYVTVNTNAPYARKGVVAAYTLKKRKDGRYVPHFLVTVIVPDGKSKINELPRGYSLIKGTLEMFDEKGQIIDVPEGYRSRFRKVEKGKAAGKKIIALRTNLYPPVMTMLQEAEEEGGVYPDNIRCIFDLGVLRLKNSRNVSRSIRTYAFELKEAIYGMAIHSLSIRFLTLNEMKHATRTRVYGNLATVRPSHYRLFCQIYDQLKAYYLSQGIVLCKRSDDKEHAKAQVISSSTILKELRTCAKKGQILSHVCGLEKSSK